MSISRSRAVVTILLLASIVLIGVSSSNQPQPAFAAATITVSPLFAGIGQFVSFSGSGFFAHTGTSFCTMELHDAADNNVTINTFTCVESGTSVTGSFIVPPTPLGIKNPYTLIVEGAGGSSDIGFTTFTIVSISINPTSGARGSTVAVNATLGGSDTTCSITGTVVGTMSCVKSTGGNFTGSFVVANVAPGPYTVRATGSPSGVFVEITFTVIGPSITLTPASGQIGTFVNMTGSGFSFADTTCAITSPSLSGVVVTPACSVNGGTGIVKGNFTIGNVAAGAYLIRVTGSPAADFAETTFHVTSGPSITLNPIKGPSGIIVNMTGTGFLPGDKTCTITGTVVTIPACSIVQGSGAPKGNFTVANAAPGTYLVTVTGNGGDSAQATFQVTVNGTLILFPTKGPTGTTVAFIATGFKATHTGCVVQSAAAGSAPGSNNLLIGTNSCTISSQLATGTFVVGSFATTNVNWNVTVRGTPGNDIPVGVWALFNVTAQISLTPTTGTNGTVVQVTGTGFSSTAATCAISSNPVSAGFSFTACGVSGSTGHVAASFTVGATAVPGLYVITITGSGPSGGLAGATFQVGMPSANITISPNTIFAPPGGFVGISGSGFNPYDTACTIDAIIGLFTASTCSAGSGSVAASITVLPTAPPGLYFIIVRGSQGDFAGNYLGVNAVTTQTSTTTSTSVFTTATTTATTTTTTGVSSSFTTTTLQTTGISTWQFVSGTATTIFGQTTTTVVSTSTTSSFVTVLTTVTTTVSTTITHTLGQIIQPSSVMRDGVGDAIGLLALLALVVPIFGRRLLS